MTKFIFLFLAFMNLACAAGNFKQSVDNIIWGSRTGSSILFTHDLNLASNPKTTVTSDKFDFSTPKLELGDPSANDDCIIFEQAISASFPTTASFPQICHNKASNVFRFATDGVTFTNFGSGGSSSNWYGSAKIVATSGQIELGNAAQNATWGVLNKADLTLTNVSWPDSTPLQIACASGEAPSGDTCTGNENLGFGFTPPDTRDFKVCVSFVHNMDALTGAITQKATIDATFAIIETTATTTTTVNIGDERQNSSFDISLNATNRQDMLTPHYLCGRFQGSASQRVFRLGYKKDADVNENANNIITFLGFNRGDTGVTWSVENVK